VIGIVLAGGTGTRLHPVTKALSKQLLPVYDKPMIYYPISTLMLAGIKEIVIITTPHDNSSFQKLLGDGSQFGVEFHFVIQEQPRGLAEAFLVSEELIQGKSTALILGDNIFHGTSLGTQLINFQEVKGASIFGYHVSNPEDYGVVSLDKFGKPLAISEKPSKPMGNLAVPGLYFYDSSVLEKAKAVRPSKRGELEITSINQMYLDEGNLAVEVLPRGTAWLDTGSFETLYEASTFVRVLQERQGYKIGCLEEIALRNNWIHPDSLASIVRSYPENSYQKYVLAVATEIKSEIGEPSEE
jgi:glucose-1-phosphate thymidylyltransferase